MIRLFLYSKYSLKLARVGFSFTVLSLLCFALAQKDGRHVTWQFTRRLKFWFINGVDNVN